jgi:outer mitochondrial transmembrane helix translocase
VGTLPFLPSCVQIASWHTVAVILLSLQRGLGPVALNDHERMLASEVIDPARVDVKFSDVGGLEDVKSSLRDTVVIPLTRPELFSGSKLRRAPKGVLLYGPPGTGKTLLAKALAKETGAAFVNVRMSVLQDMWFGESVKLSRAVFTLASKIAPAIVFIDEIDSFLRERSKNDHEAMAQMKAEFLMCWDGLSRELMEDAMIVVIGATNRPQVLSAISHSLSPPSPY